MPGREFGTIQIFKIARMEIKKMRLGSIKEMLTKDQMKKITGGAVSGCVYQCCVTGSGCGPCDVSNPDSCGNGYPALCEGGDC
jgi:hypothetical protein